MIPKLRTFAFATMALGAVMSAHAALVGFDDMAAQALANTDADHPNGRPITLVPGSAQVPGFSFTNATVYHVDQTKPGSGYGYAAPKDEKHPGFVQSRAADNSINPTIAVALAGDFASGDIEAISFDLANGQTDIRLWAYNASGTGVFFPFAAGSAEAWTWRNQSQSFANLGVIKRLKFESIAVDSFTPAFALDQLNFTLAGSDQGAVPEPASLGLVALALAGVGLASRRRSA